MSTVVIACRGVHSLKVSILSLYCCIASAVKGRTILLNEIEFSFDFIYSLWATDVCLIKNDVDFITYKILSLETAISKWRN